MPNLTRSMQIAITDLQLEEIVVIYAGDKKLRLSPNVICMPLDMFLSTYTII